MSNPLYKGTSLNLQTGEETIVYLTPEEIAALPPPPTLDERNEAIKVRRNIAMADPITGSDCLYIAAQASGKTEALAKWRKRRQEIIDSLPLEAE